MKTFFLFLSSIALATFCSSQSYFNMVTSFPASECEPYCNPNPNYNEIKIYDAFKIKQAFDYISKKSFVQFNYPQGGCPERAILIKFFLDSMRIDNFRIWLFAPSRLIENDERKIFINDKNQLTTGKDNKIEWDFHVAPCVLTKGKDGTVDTFVIDPSINGQEPMMHSKWLTSIGDHEYGQYTFLDGKYYMFNRQNGGNSNVINGYFYPYEGFAYDNLWVEKMMALNDVAYAMFKKYIQGKPSSSTAYDLKTVIGNSATLKEVLEYRNGSPSPSKLRTLSINHSNFINQAWTLFNNRLIYWTKRIEKMRK